MHVRTMYISANSQILRKGITNRKYYFWIVFVLDPRVETRNVTVFESDKTVDVEVKRSGMLNSNIVLNVVTMNGTAFG